jgi:hypothetical protein
MDTVEENWKQFKETIMALKPALKNIFQKRK